MNFKFVMNLLIEVIMQNKLIIVIGAYGSGKSEYAINIAKQLQTSSKRVTLVDLDVVNPYFRSRNMREKFLNEGIDVIAPEGEFMHADLPMLSPRIQGAIDDLINTVVLDVGGDPNGCKALGRYIPSIKNRGYQMHLVVNTKRPFTSNKTGIIEMKNTLERASKLKVTELISNTNLMDNTNINLIKDGINILNDVAQETKIPFNKFLVLKKHSKDIPDKINGKQKTILEYFLNKPWEMKNKVHMKGI